MSLALIVLAVLAGALIAAGAVLAVIRIVRGPTLLDRMIGSDVLLTTVILVLGADMVVGQHTSNVVLMIVLAAVAFVATVAVARTVSKQERPTGGRGSGGGPTA